MRGVTMRAVFAVSTVVVVFVAGCVTGWLTA